MSRYATRYGLDGPGSNPGGGWDFLHPSIPAMGPTHPPIQLVPGLFPEGKAAGAWRWPPTPSSAEVKERVQLYFYSPSGNSWPVPGWTLRYFHSIIKQHFSVPKAVHCISGISFTIPIPVPVFGYWSAILQNLCAPGRSHSIFRSYIEHSKFADTMATAGDFPWNSVRKKLPPLQVWSLKRDELHFQSTPHVRVC
jgi:hypothetical protein